MVGRNDRDGDSRKPETTRKGDRGGASDMNDGGRGTNTVSTTLKPPKRPRDGDGQD